MYVDKVCAYSIKYKSGKKCDNTLIRGRNGFDGDVEAGGASSGEDRYKTLNFKIKR